MSNIYLSPKEASEKYDIQPKTLARLAMGYLQLQERNPRAVQFAF